MPVPHDRRGARIGELVTEILGSRDENLDDESVFQLSGKLALRIEDRMGLYPEIRTRTDLTEERSGRTFTVYSRTAARDLLTYGIAMTGVNACPCAQDTIIERMRASGIPPAPGSGIITHNQRVRVKVLITSRNVPKLSEVVQPVSGIIHGPLSSVISPDAEADLLTEIHSDPLFVEDIVRRIAMSISEIDSLNNDDRIIVKCRSMESIHPHDLLAEIDSELGKLRKH